MAEADGDPVLVHCCSIKTVACKMGVIRGGTWIPIVSVPPPLTMLRVVRRGDTLLLYSGDVHVGQTVYELFYEDLRELLKTKQVALDVEVTDLPFNVTNKAYTVQRLPLLIKVFAAADIADIVIAELVVECKRAPMTTVMRV